MLKYRHRYRVRAPGGAHELLAVARRVWAYAEEPEYLRCWFDTRDVATLSAIAPHLGATSYGAYFATDAPGELLDALPPAERLEFSQIEVNGEPGTRVDREQCSVDWWWRERVKGLTRGSEEVHAAREPIGRQLVARMEAFVAAGALRSSGPVEPWVRRILVPGRGYEDSGEFGRAWWEIDPGPPPTPVAVTLELRPEAVGELVRRRGVWHAGAPVEVRATLPGDTAAVLSPPAGTLRSLELGGDPGPGLDVLFALALREADEERFTLFGECSSWRGQDDYLTTGTTLTVRSDEREGAYVLDLETDLRFPASLAVTDEIAAEWSASTEEALAAIAREIGVALEPLE